MDQNGTLAVLKSPTKGMFFKDESKNVDWAIAELRRPAETSLDCLPIDKVKIPDFVDDGSEGIRVICVGSPSSIVTRDCREKALGPMNASEFKKSVSPKIRSNDVKACEHDRYFFYPVGKIKSKRKADKAYADGWDDDPDTPPYLAFAHTAVEFEGMSGGGIYDSDGNLLGIHYSYDEGTGHGYATSTKAYLKKMHSKGDSQRLLTTCSMRDTTL